MQTDEPTPEYTGFLRSGQYPILSKKLVQCSGLVARVGGLAAIALFASGAGYVLTQWLVPVRSAQADVQLAEAALPSSLHPASSDFGPARGIELARTATGVVGSLEPAPGPEPLREDAPRELAVATRPQPGHAAIGTRKPRARTPENNEPASGPSAENKPASSEEAGWQLPASDSERTEHIADRVRALEEQPAEKAPAEAVGASAASAGAEPALVALPAHDFERAPEPSVRRPVSLTSSTPLATAPRPQLSAPVPQLRAAATIEDLSVRGSLSASNVRRSVERLRPALAACYERAAQQAGRNRFGRVELSLTIDETGRARAPHVEGAELPGFGACLSTVTSKLVSQAPDTGTVRASITLNFKP